MCRQLGCATGCSCKRVNAPWLLLVHGGDLAHRLSCMLPRLCLPPVDLRTHLENCRVQLPPSPLAPLPAQSRHTRRAHTLTPPPSCLGSLLSRAPGSHDGAWWASQQNCLHCGCAVPMAARWALECMLESSCRPLNPSTCMRP